jgi:hypothetical protein
LAGRPIFNNGFAVGPKGGAQGLRDITGGREADGVLDFESISQKQPLKIKKDLFF